MERDRLGLQVDFGKRISRRLDDKVMLMHHQPLGGPRSRNIIKSGGSAVPVTPRTYTFVSLSATCTTAADLCSHLLSAATPTSPQNGSEHLPDKPCDELADVLRGFTSPQEDMAEELDSPSDVSFQCGTGGGVESGRREGTGRSQTRDGAGESDDLDMVNPKNGSQQRL